MLPSWAKDRTLGSKLINARVETVTAKPAFKAAARKRRCIIPADGYFEWQKQPGVNKKIPHFLHAEGELLAMAGLYELWPDPERDAEDPERWVWTCTIITTEAPDALGHIHDRSPLLLPPGEFRNVWLDPKLTDAEEVQALLNSVPQPRLTPRVVSTAVNSTRNNGPEFLEAVQPE